MPSSVGSISSYKKIGLPATTGAAGTRLVSRVVSHHIERCPDMLCLASSGVRLGQRGIDWHIARATL